MRAVLAVCVKVIKKGEVFRLIRLQEWGDFAVLLL